MKLQDYIVPIVLSFFVMFTTQYFFSKFAQKTEDSASFAVSRQTEVVLPLRETIDYERKNSKIKPSVSKICTHWGEIGLSTTGGSIIYIEHDLISNRKTSRTIQTISHDDDITKQTPTFLLALNEKTPLYYNLDAETLLFDKAIVQYSVENEQARIIKKFTIPYDNYRIDLEITIIPKQKPLEFVRVIFQAPQVLDVGGIATIGAVVVDKKGQTQRAKDAATIFDQGWNTPEIFGSENQYFTHLFFFDKNHDVARAYYVGKDTAAMNTVLEFEPIVEERVIDLSFYMGPKEQDALTRVDQKIASIFEYKGLLAPIYNVLFMLLKLLYKYIGNFGIAIMALTLLIKIVLLPLTIKTEEAQKRQKEFEKKMNYLNQKYKHNDEQLQLARAEIVKEQGFSLIGTLFLAFIVQIPLFVCFNYMLGSTVELYNAPFLWIPDLSACDPFYILPLFVVGSMIANAPNNIDAKKKMNTILIALVVGAIATRFSAGLGLYFVANTLLAIAQTFLIKKFSSRA